MSLRSKFRPLLASIIVLTWLVVEMLYGINHPTLELRLMLVAALVWMFGESVKDAVNIIRGSENDSDG
jgi:hypothetical protein